MREGAWTTEIQLAGPGGEPVDLWRTIQSHGLVDLPPMRIDEEARALEITVPLPSSRPRTVEISQGRAGHAKLTVADGFSPYLLGCEALTSTAVHEAKPIFTRLFHEYGLPARREDTWAIAHGGRPA